MAFQGDSIYWVEVEKVVPNPFQPRREFDESKLQELSESIRMYGVLQPLTVTRQEVQNENGTFFTQYELIAGERRLRASRLAGVAQVPVIIREGEDSEQEKLELAIIENLQREDLNAIDRALAFQQLSEQFKLNQAEVGRKVGRSREYVANSIRLLQLPEHMRLSLQKGDLGEGHARTLLMLNDRPEEQETVFREVLLKKMSVRELERIARKIATDKVRKHQLTDIDQHLIDIEKKFTETLGTRVQIQKTEFGGKLTIDYFSEDDLSELLDIVQKEKEQNEGQQQGAAFSFAEPSTQPTIQLTQTSAPVVQQNPVEQFADRTPLNFSLAENLPQTPPPVDPYVVPVVAPLTPVYQPAPAPQPAVVNTPNPAPVPVPEAPIFTPAPQPVNLVSSTPIHEMPVTPPVVQPIEEVEPPQKNDPEPDQDLYSLSRFTV